MTLFYPLNLEIQSIAFIHPPSYSSPFMFIMGNRVVFVIIIQLWIRLIPSTIFNLSRFDNTMTDDDEPCLTWQIFPITKRDFPCLFNEENHVTRHPIATVAIVSISKDRKIISTRCQINSVQNSINNYRHQSESRNILNPRTSSRTHIIWSIIYVPNRLMRGIGNSNDPDSRS